jgi:hypothetical protein
MVYNFDAVPQDNHGCSPAIALTYGRCCKRNDARKKTGVATAGFRDCSRGVGPRAVALLMIKCWHMMLVMMMVLTMLQEKLAIIQISDRSDLGFPEWLLGNVSFVLP